MSDDNVSEQQPTPIPKKGVTRRGFLQALGLGAGALALGWKAERALAQEQHSLYNPQMVGVGDSDAPLLPTNPDANPFRKFDLSQALPDYDSTTALGQQVSNHLPTGDLITQNGGRAEFNVFSQNQEANGLVVVTETPEGQDSFNIISNNRPIELRTGSRLSVDQTGEVHSITPYFPSMSDVTRITVDAESQTSIQGLGEIYGINIRPEIGDVLLVESIVVTVDGGQPKRVVVQTITQNMAIPNLSADSEEVRAVAAPTPSPTSAQPTPTIAATPVSNPEMTINFRNADLTIPEPLEVAMAAAPEAVTSSETFDEREVSFSFDSPPTIERFSLDEPLPDYNAHRLMLTADTPLPLDHAERIDLDPPMRVLYALLSASAFFRGADDNYAYFDFINTNSGKRIVTRLYLRQHLAAEQAGGIFVYIDTNMQDSEQNWGIHPDIQGWTGWLDDPTNRQLYETVSSLEIGSQVLFRHPAFYNPTREEEGDLAREIRLFQQNLANAIIEGGDVPVSQQAFNYNSSTTIVAQR